MTGRHEAKVGRRGGPACSSPAGQLSLQPVDLQAPPKPASCRAQSPAPMLVANTLCRFQGEMQPGPAPILQAALGPSEGSSMPSVLACNLSEPSWRLMSPPSLSPPMGDLLLSDGDSSAFLDFLEDSSDVAQPKKPPLSLFSPEAEWIPHACPSSTLDLLSPGSYLLEDSLEGVLEDIDISMFDCDLWLLTSLPNFKEAFCSPGEQVPGLADRLDCLMDVLVGVQEL